MNEPNAETIERWRRKGFDLRYGPRWYLHYDGRPPIDDDRAWVWSVAAQCWQVDYDYEDEVDEDALEEFEERKRERIARANEY